MSPFLAALFALFVPFLGSLATALVPRARGAVAGSVALAVAAASTGLLVFAASTTSGASSAAFEWAPVVGLSPGLLLDRLSLFFALVVAGMGVLVSFYATRYLHDEPGEHPRFFSSLLLFMGAMLGVALSSHLLGLFVFWELTGLASFLLIGFDFSSPAGMRGARLALLTTAGTGLLLMLGVVLVGEAYGTYDLPTILSGAPRDAELLALAVPFLLAGAFGKSAQFPLQYWLPNAMAAPTPVSAYLHSATMVKLGVFLIARLSPAFAGSPDWNDALLFLCFSTCAFGAFLALLSHDLKAILAYSTVSQLGALMGFYAIGSGSAQGADLLHVGAHVLYKGGLFMLAGVVDHACGTRDLRLLGGLGKRSPALMVLGFALCLSLASLPGTLAFVSKELVIADFLAAAPGDSARAGIPFALYLVAAVLKVAIAARVFFHLFIRRDPASVPERSSPGAHAADTPSGAHSAHGFHAPGAALLAAPALLAFLSLALGLVPGLLVPLLARAGAGVPVPDVPELHAWHGFSAPFLYSLGVTAAGAALYAGISAFRWERLRIPRALEFDRAFDVIHDAAISLGKGSVRALGGDSASAHLPIILGVIATTGLAILVRWHDELLDPALFASAATPSSWSGDVITRVTTCIVMALGGVVVIFARQVLTRLVATSLIGLLATVLYVLFRAPDLALTQILVETLVLIATVILLVRLRAVEFVRADETRGAKRLVHLAVALAVGTLVAGLVLVVGSRDLGDAGRVGTTYLGKSLPDAAGTNAVNTILVDFRGTDTLFEITVLFIAALGCIGLVAGGRGNARARGRRAVVVTGHEPARGRGGATDV